MKVALGQLCSGEQIAENLDAITALARASKLDGADLLALPENAPQLAPDHVRLADVESLDGHQISTLRQCARELGIALALGSFSERGPDPQHSFNTSVFIDGAGEIAAVYRKIHLFDVAVAADTSFRESDTVAAGPAIPVVVELGGWRLGLSICYDLRFPELYRGLADQGADVLLVPAAFTFRTGASHWETLLRARAIENQCYVIAAGQVGRHYGSRESWGHSMVVDPWGDVIALDGGGPGRVLASLDRARLESVRAAMPCGSHRRF